MTSIDDTYPEHAKLMAMREKSQAIGELLDVSGYVLCEYVEGFNNPKPVGKTINQILADYFHIDLKVIEEEKRQMLAVLTASEEETT